jgi:hypothetical protein
LIGKTKYYILASLCIFSLSALVLSLLNVEGGRKIFFFGDHIFFFHLSLLFLFVVILLLAFHFNKYAHLNMFISCYFCFFLVAIKYVTIGSFPFDIDSLISMKSMGLMSDNGFSESLLSDSKNIAIATYSFPLLSILGSVLMMFLDISELFVAKLLPLILILIFLLVYYAALSRIFNPSIASISLLVFCSFPLILNLGNTFHNATIALSLIIVCLWMHSRYSNGSANIVYMLLYTIACFALLVAHHLTFIFFILVLLFLFFIVIVRGERSETSIGNQKRNIILCLTLSITLVLFYYIFVSMSPLHVFIDTFRFELAIEAKPVSSPAAWDITLILQRGIYLAFTLFFGCVLIVGSRGRAVNNKDYQKLFLTLGILLFVVSIVILMLKMPLNWDRVAIFAWLFYIPGSIALAYDMGHSNGKKIKFVALLLIALIFYANISTIPTDHINHTGDMEYGDAFKNWINNQEWVSAFWTFTHSNHGDSILGDEIIRRIYLAHSFNYNRNFYYLSRPLEEPYLESPCYVFIRKENIYRIIGSFSSSHNAQEDLLSYDDIYSILNSGSYGRIYGNGEVNVYFNV